MTKVISAIIIVVLLWGGWQMFFYWEKVKNQEDLQKKQEASETQLGDQLRGMPYQLEAGLRTAQEHGAAGLKNFLKAYGTNIQDPRKAWIELDYCVLVSREDPSEARRVFKEVKSRTDSSSPVWPRIQRLQKTYE